MEHLTKLDNKKIKIFVGSHKKVFIPNSSLFEPIELGAKFRDKHFYELLDSTKINIGEENKALCELTGIYWMWKNYEADYYGFCHYRRYFSFKKISDSLIETTPDNVVSKFAEHFDNTTLNQISPLPGKLNNLLDNYDIFLPRRVKLPISCYQQYIGCPQHGKNDIETLLNICEEINPKFKKYVIKSFNSCYFYPFNMFIMKKSYFNEYCETIFPILLQYLKKSPKTNSVYSTRKPGMLAERMMYAFFLMIKEENPDLRYKELDVIQINDPVNVTLEPINNGKNCILINNNLRAVQDVIFSLLSMKKNADNKKTYDVVIVGSNAKQCLDYVNALNISSPNFSVRFWNIGLRLNNQNIYEILSQFSKYEKVVYICGRILFNKDINDLLSINMKDKAILAAPHIDPLLYLGYESTLSSYEVFYDNSLFVANVPELLKNYENASWLAKLLLCANLCKFNECAPHISNLDFKWNTISYHYSIQEDILLALIPNQIHEIAINAYKDPFCINYNFINLNSPVPFFRKYNFDAFYSPSSQQAPIFINQTKPRKKLIDILLPRGSKRRAKVKAFLNNRKVNKNQNTNQVEEDLKPKYNLENPISIRTYHEWLNKEKFNKLVSSKLLFSIVIPVYNVKSDQLTACIESVLDQTYQNFELILVDDCSTYKNVKTDLEKYKNNPKITIKFKEKNGGISDTTNVCLSLAHGDFIVFMDCDDTLDKHALNEVAFFLEKNPHCDFVYSDEDKITEDGKIRHLPFFKPDWSPDLFLSMMYTNHLGVYRKSVVDKVGKVRSKYDGAQDYDFTLRFLEYTDNKKVGHIAKVLYHWRERKESIASSSSAKSYGVDLAREARNDLFKSKNIPVEFKYNNALKQDVVVYKITNNPLVSIIIPSKDNVESLIRTIESIRKITSYQNYEIIVVDNGSSENNKVDIEYLKAEYQFKYIYEKCAFNFSKMCNDGAKISKGQYLIFLNDDIEICNPDWIEVLIGHAQQKHVGCVGMKLLFPNTTIIQHAGVSSRAIGPCHEFYRFNDQSISYFGLDKLAINTLIVTGACLAISKTIFDKVGKFDESFPTEYNDVDLCMKVYKAGYYNVCRNDIFSYHHEGLTRELNKTDSARQKEINQYKEKLYKKYPEFLLKDPFVNENLDAYSDILLLKNVSTKKQRRITNFFNKHPRLKRLAKKLLGK